MPRSVKLSVPAEASFARTVRMTAANLAVVMDLGVDEVEDLRMAAEEGFVLACATHPDVCDVAFVLDETELRMSFSLGADDPEEGETDLDLVELLLAAVCDEFGVTEDGSVLNITKTVTCHAA